MTTPSLADLRRAYYGGGSDAEYEFLQTAQVNADVDNVKAQYLVTLPDNAMNGFVVKASPGNDAGYGQGQAFMVLEHGVGDATDATDAGSVLFRVDRDGNLGLTGGIHVATGLRVDDPPITQAVWIDPADNLIPLVIHNPSVAESAAWDKDFLSIRDVRGAGVDVFRIKSDGNVESTMSLKSKVGAVQQTIIGDTFGFAGISMGQVADTLLWRAAAGHIGVASLFEFGEIADPGVSAANKARLFCRDVAGKTQLAARFPTGAVVAIATEP